MTQLPPDYDNWRSDDGYPGEEDDDYHDDPWHDEDFEILPTEGNDK